MTLSLCIDARFTEASGIGTYIRGLLQALAENPPAGLALSLLVSPHHPHRWPWPTRAVASGMYSVSEQWTVPAAFRESKARLIHIPHYNAPVTLSHQSILTVHDLIHLKFPEFLPSRFASAYASFFFRCLVPRARAILVPSQHTRCDLLERLDISPERIIVTPEAASPRFRPADEAEKQRVRNHYDLPPEYFLYVGNLKAFKNVPRLVRLYSRLAQRRPVPRLVLVGRNFIDGFEKELARVPAVRWLPEAAFDDLPAIYSAALGFVYPSLYEGFGLPPLEAMACGTPVISSNRASLPEVVGDAACLVDPEDDDAITAALERLMDDAAFRRDLTERGQRRAAGFSWSRMAGQTVDVYRRCLENIA
ncbi:MAG: glycosyltransferase family 1 protein [Elusimicrobiota bacterium]|jgi:alpha-1,3-rhamnosyl/mannosyltransferase